MRSTTTQTGVWQDTAAVPEAISRTLDLADGFDDVVKAMTAPGVRRIVASGNGSSFYVAHALWMAALHAPHDAPDLVGVPAGLLCAGGFGWRAGDLLLAVSSSGEFRDLLDAIDDPRRPGPYVAISANPSSSIASGAVARATITVPDHRAVTHTQDFCAGLAAAMAIWARVSGDDALAAAVAESPAAMSRAIATTEEWDETVLPGVAVPVAAVVYGTGPAWTAAIETALMIKEIAGIPTEGLETREGGTSAMTAAAAGQLFVGLPTSNDRLLEEAGTFAAVRGARVLAAPGGTEADPRLAAMTTFPAAIALSVHLALQNGSDADNPPWIDLYYQTARRPAMPQSTRAR